MTDEEIAAVGASVPAGMDYTRRRDRAIADAAGAITDPVVRLHLTAMHKYFTERGQSVWADVVSNLLRGSSDGESPNG